jgi:hypothetical protein
MDTAWRARVGWVGSQKNQTCNTKQLEQNTLWLYVETNGVEAGGGGRGKTRCVNSCSLHSSSVPARPCENVTYKFTGKDNAVTAELGLYTGTLVYMRTWDQNTHDQASNVAQSVVACLTYPLFQAGGPVSSITCKQIPQVAPSE